MSFCAVPFGTRSFSVTYPALTCRALDCSVPTGLVGLRDLLRASIGLSGLGQPKAFNLNGEIEISKKLIWTSMKFSFSSLVTPVMHSNGNCPNGHQRAMVTREGVAVYRTSGGNRYVSK